MIRYGAAMFESWGEYFFMIGSSAAALIGLMFVVVTLTAGRDREEVERGKHLYTSPIVWHLAVVLVLSGAAIAPTVPSELYGYACGGLALIGIAMGIRSAFGIARRPGSPDAAGFDTFWYGVAPAIVYVGLAGAALAVLGGARWASTAVAGDLMALLLVSIHAEWDLVTYLAPRATPASTQETQRGGGGSV
jgi:hypothetical protein